MMAMLRQVDSARDAPCMVDRADCFPASPETPRNARLLVGAALADWGLMPLLDDVSLCASELVTNALQHTECERHMGGREPWLVVALRRRGWWSVVLDVGDGDLCPPRRPRPQDPGVELGGAC